MPEVRTIRPAPSSQTARVNGAVVNRAVYGWLRRVGQRDVVLGTRHGDEVLGGRPPVDLPVPGVGDGARRRLEEAGGDGAQVGVGGADRQLGPDGPRRYPLIEVRAEGRPTGTKWWWSRSTAPGTVPVDGDGNVDRLVVVKDRSGPANRMSPTTDRESSLTGPVDVPPSVDRVTVDWTRWAVPAASVRATDWRMRAGRRPIPAAPRCRTSRTPPAAAADRTTSPATGSPSCRRGAAAVRRHDRPVAQPNSMALYSDSLWSGCRASMSRTVPDLDRMTRDWVLAPNSS